MPDPADIEFRLLMEGPDGKRTTMLWRPHNCELIFADGRLPDLSRVHKTYLDRFLGHRQASRVGPGHPLGKSRSIRRLKIMLGKACNYACGYCSQAEQREDQSSNPADVDRFLASLPDWFEGGEDGLGQGVRVEIWGGEPFVYWKTLQRLVPGLKARYPNLDAIFMFTNGSLLDEEKVAWLDEHIGFVAVSHDGPDQAARGPDPFDHPVAGPALMELIRRLHPARRISLNSMATARNYDVAAIRRWFVERTGVADITVATGDFLTPYDPGSLLYSPDGEEEHRTIRRTLAAGFIDWNGLSMPNVNKKIEGFFNALASHTPSETLWQKCGMDAPNALAVDLKGNVSTCQNVAAEGRHHLGNVADLNSVRLEQVRHWSRREECPRCPVLPLCLGECMFLEGIYWQRACDNAFTYNLAVLAASLWFLTGMRLVGIEGDPIRRDGITSIDF
jgi:uncharacterized protein